MIPFWGRCAIILVAIGIAILVQFYSLSPVISIVSAILGIIVFLTTGIPSTELKRKDLRKMSYPELESLLRDMRVAIRELDSILKESASIKEFTEMDRPSAINTIDAVVKICKKCFPRYRDLFDAYTPKGRMGKRKASYHEVLRLMELLRREFLLQVEEEYVQRSKHKIPN